MSEIEKSTRKSRLILLFSGIGVLAVLAVLYFVVRPAVIRAKQPNQSGIIDFQFERKRSDGSEIRLRMKKKGDEAQIILYDSETGGKRTGTCPESKLSELQQLMEENGLCALDNYKEEGPIIGNENSFSMQVSYVNGIDLSASGVTVLPEGIDEMTDLLVNFFAAALLGD